jgi:hypothetical protein
MNSKTPWVFPNPRRRISRKAPFQRNQSVATPVHQAESVDNPLHIERAVTADLPDGQACPPYYDGAIWRVVRRTDGRTIWRRIFLSPSLVTVWRTAPGDQTRAP